MRYNNNLRYAANILGQYSGQQPLALWLKDFYRDNKQMGSGDRHIVSELVYCYFRIGKIGPGLDAGLRILVAFFLCNHESSAFLEHLKPSWNLHISNSVEDKFLWLKEEEGINLMSDELFIYKDSLSPGINTLAFERSFLKQPKLFLRIRPNKKNIVKKKLDVSKCHYRLIDGNTLELNAGTKVDKILNIDDEVVVQDFNSQQTGSLLKLVKHGTVSNPIRVWDCCAASGGKSIMAVDLVKNMNLTVSDKRESILDNLHSRFAKAGINNYNYFVADLSRNFKRSGTQIHRKAIGSSLKVLNNEDKNEKNTFDLIICDVPCTGSGTWARSPEQLFYFNESEIERCSTLQKKILDNVIPFLAPGGQLLYITCSVFNNENDDNVAYIQETLDMQLITASVFKGYSIYADTLYAALLSSPV